MREFQDRISGEPIGGWRDGKIDGLDKIAFDEIIGRLGDVEAADNLVTAVTDGTAPPQLPTNEVPVDLKELMRKIYDEYPGRGHQY